jgi:RHS repeat-associated protein
LIYSLLHQRNDSNLGKKKYIPVSLAQYATVTQWQAEVVQAQDYWPFGSEIEERQYVASWAGNLSGGALGNASGGAYRYGFNGIERESEGGAFDYAAEYRLYNSQIGRWLSKDPRPRTGWSPYSAMDNSPIGNSDPRGDTTQFYSRSGRFLGVVNDSYNNQIHFVTRGQWNRVISKNLVVDPMKLGQTRQASNVDELALYSRIYSWAYIGPNTAKALFNVWRTTGERGGFLYRTDNSRELQVYECAECASSTGQIEFGKIGLGNNITNIRRLLGQRGFAAVASWHTHPSIGGYTESQQRTPSDISRDHSPDRDRNDQVAGSVLGKLDIAGTRPLLNVSGGPGIIVSQYGITLYQHFGMRGQGLEDEGETFHSKLEEAGHQTDWPTFPAGFFKR